MKLRAEFFGGSPGAISRAAVEHNHLACQLADTLQAPREVLLLIQCHHGNRNGQARLHQPSIRRALAAFTLKSKSKVRWTFAAKGNPSAALRALAEASRFSNRRIAATN